MQTSVPTSIILFAAATAALAQPPLERSRTAVLDPIVVTASRSPQSITELLADVTVIERDEIERAGVESLAELLQRKPGIEIVQNGGPGSVSGVFLRGGNTNQTLVLIDGIRIASSTTGATPLEAIPLSAIERIEVLRGPASSLYGADAMAGVVQIFTRRGSEATRLFADAGYGTYNTQQYSAGISGNAGALLYSVHGGYRSSTGFNAIVNPLNFSYDPDTDGYVNPSVTASAALTIADGHELSATYFGSRLTNQFDGGDSFNDRTKTTLQAARVELVDRFLPNWTSRLFIAEGIDDSVSETAFGNAPFDTRQRQYTWQNDLALAKGLLSVVLERREENVTTQVDYPVTERNTNSITGIYLLREGQHVLQANLRHDDSSQYGGKTTGALAYGYRLAPEWRITAAGGTAFKAPSFNDLYFPGFSNPNLQPETSRNVEAGVHWTGTVAAAGQRAGAEAHVVFWYNRVDDLIVFECDASFNCAPNNVDNATLKGVTLSGALDFGAVASLSGSVTFQSPENDATGNLLPRRARRHGSIAWSQALGPLRVGVEMIASSLRYDDAENTIPLGGYASFNVTAEWPVTANWTLFARGDNVFDRNYQLAADFSNGGARYFVGIRGRL